MNSNVENSISSTEMSPNEVVTYKEMTKVVENIHMDQISASNSTELITPVKEIDEPVKIDTKMDDALHVTDNESMLVDVNESSFTEPLVEEPRQEKLTKFPMGRVKHIMKMDPDVRVVTPEATFLISKSLELFVESLVWEAHRYTEQARKKTMAKVDVERAIDGVDALAFLEGALYD